MVLGMFGASWTSYNEVIQHDSVRTTARHSHHRVGVLFARNGENSTILNSLPFWHVRFHVCPVQYVV